MRPKLCFLLVCVTIYTKGYTNAENAIYPLSDDFIACQGMDNDTFHEAVDRLNYYLRMKADYEGNNFVPVTKSVLGDQMYTLKGVNKLIAAFEEERGGQRTKRKAVNIANEPDLAWSFPIKYGFDGGHDATQQALIISAIEAWEAATCVRFQQDNGSPDIVFSKGDNTECSSYIGNVSMELQPINLADDCLHFIGTPLHELGHALGLYHEHIRPDRETYVNIFEENIENDIDILSNFEILPSSEIDCLGVPYDYASTMHYSRTAFAVNYSLVTIATTDPAFATTIGQIVQLSFYDVMTMNRLYCNDTCTGVGTPPTCSGESYQDPNACSNCLCPGGMSGASCDTLSGSSAICSLTTATLQADTAQKCFLSPLFNQDVPHDTFCYWKIQASAPNRRIQYEIFQYAGVCFGDDPNFMCAADWVEIKEFSAVNGERFCCGDRRTMAHVSTTDAVLVTMNKQFVGSQSPDRLSFQLCYSEVSACDSICHANASCVEVNGAFQCQCNTGFTGNGTECTLTGNHGNEDQRQDSNICELVKCSIKSKRS